VIEGVRLEGGAKLRRELKEAGVDLKDLTRLHREVADIVLPVARSTAPEGPEAGGHIRSSIRAGATRSASIIRVGTTVAGAFPYANPIHWGWFRHGIKPNSWVSRAAQQTEAAWAPRFFAGIDRILDQIKGDDTIHV